MKKCDDNLVLLYKIMYQCYMWLLPTEPRPATKKWLSSLSISKQHYNTHRASEQSENYLWSKINVEAEDAPLPLKILILGYFSTAVWSKLNNLQLKSKFQRILLNCTSFHVEKIQRNLAIEDYLLLKLGQTIGCMYIESQKLVQTL